MGRLYLPAEALAAAGIETRDPTAVVADPAASTPPAAGWRPRRTSTTQAADAVLAQAPRAGSARRG